MSESPTAEVETKIEELDDDDSDNQAGPDTTPTPRTPDATSPETPGSATGPPIKRPRGRPRKHPLPPPDSQQKIAKGRSKTGCITCRRRKKKCDETKPQCTNCQKNAVVCEGYPEKVYWKSGRERAEEARAARAGTRPQELRPLVDGIETEMDRCLFEHFEHKASRVLTLFSDDRNPFKVLLLPMAARHKGLMHSLLCFSGSHMASINQKPINERQRYHYYSAVKELALDKKLDARAKGTSDEPVDDPTIATVLVLCLDTICSGSVEGEYRPHLQAAKYILNTQRCGDQAFAEFLVEFFTYHDTISALTTLDRRPPLLGQESPLPNFIIQRGEEDRAFLGVFDGLFDFLAGITKLRDIIRDRKAKGLQPVVDYQAISDAVSLDCSIRTWMNTQPPDTPRFIAAQLYRQCTWIYLWRTIYPSRSTPKIIEAVDEGLDLLQQLPPDAPTQSILLMPVFILGCAAFEPEQRPALRKAFGTLKRYSNLKNIEPAKDVVEKVWSIMDADDDDASWDWENIIKGMGYDFLVT
ncbi:MAG: hypothetical protein M1816_004234 [Peltula sp. TS41687]|nr:MAG: hypothetical protein M1816_004234 [Peltula sp. TS41687]